MALIELIFNSDCPNADAAREQLRQALRLAGREPTWVEWDRESPDSPAHASRFGSPTILVNGRDISGKDTESDASSCRVYQNENGGFGGAPSPEDILSAIRDEEFTETLITEMGACRLDAALARVSLHIIRSLARGRPLSSQEAGLDGAEAARLRERIEMLGTEFDETGDIVGFGGLSLRPTRHALVLPDGSELFAWCAADTLFLPALLGQEIQVHSSCLATGRPIRLRVSPTGVEEVTPAEAVVSLTTAGTCSASADTSCCEADAAIDLRGLVGATGSFCGSIHFFAEREAAAGWQEEHPDSMIFEIGEATRLARRIWADPLLAATIAET